MRPTIYSLRLIKDEKVTFILIFFIYFLSFHCTIDAHRGG
jgi:hypothetical protein